MGLVLNININFDKNISNFKFQKMEEARCSKDTTSTNTSFSESDDYNESLSAKRACKMDESIHYRSLVNAPKNATSFFHVTISLRIYETRLQKKEFYDRLREEHPKLECLVDFHEDKMYKTNFRSSTRVDVLLDTRYMNSKRYKSVIIFNWINNLLREIVGPEQALTSGEEIKYIDYAAEISIKKARPIKALKKVTELDFDPCFSDLFSDHLNDGLFCENYKIEHWSRNAIYCPYDPSDPFLRKPGFTKTKEYLREYYENKRELYFPTPKQTLKRCNIGPFGDWRDIIKDWFNDWVDNGWQSKKLQLFLWGEKSNTGKTFFVEQVILRHSDEENKIPDELICRPHRKSTRFGWECVNRDQLLIYINEFRLEDYDINVLKQMLEGDFATCEQKGKKSGPPIRLKVPAIFVSNFDLPDYIRVGNNRKETTVNLRARFLFVKIPDDAKIYSKNDANPYIEMFKKEAHELKENSSNLPDTKPVINTAETKHIAEIKDETELQDKKSKEIEIKLSSKLSRLNTI
jgi:hypothetical protein